MADAPKAPKVKVVGYKIGDQTYPFDGADITNDEGMALERAIGKPFDWWVAGLNAGSMLAMTGLVWLLRHRENPNLRFDDVHFRVGEVEPVVEEVPPSSDRGASPEVVPGGRTAPMDKVDPTPAPPVSTGGASAASDHSPTSTASTLPPSAG